MEVVYSEVTVRIVPEMSLAQYAVVSSSPEADAIAHILDWSEKSGLTREISGKPRVIGWDFPFVSEEQREVFGMRGYVAACVLPDGFISDCEGAEIVRVAENRYASVTVAGPRDDSLRRIPNGYKKIFEFIEQSDFAQSWDSRVSFEEEYSVDGVCYMDIYVPIK